MNEIHRMIRAFASNCYGTSSEKGCLDEQDDGDVEYAVGALLTLYYMILKFW